MKKLKLFRPLRYTLKYAKEIIIASSKKEYLNENIPPKVWYISTNPCPGFRYTVASNGWLCFGSDDSLELENIKQSKRQGDGFDRSPFLKTNPEHAGKQVKVINIHFSKGANFGRDSDFLIVDEENKFLQTQYGALYSPNWNADCPEAMKTLYENWENHDQDESEYNWEDEDNSYLNADVHDEEF